MEIKKAFQEELVKRLTEGLGDSVCIAVAEKTRNNGHKEPAIFIQRDGNENAAICLGMLYQTYCENSYNLEPIADSILQDFKNLDKVKQEKENLMSYQSVRNQLYLKVINAEANLQRLKQLPHVLYLDLAVVFYVLIDNCSENSLTLEVTDSLLDMWEVDLNDIYKDALQNMGKEAIPPQPIDVVLKDIIQNEYAAGDINLEDYTTALKAEKKEDRMYVLTNERSLLGACRLLDVYALQKLSDHLGSSLYLIPSSLHEILILPSKATMKPEEIGSIIREINQTEVEAQDRLSNSVYLFDRELHSTRILREGAPL